MNRWDDVSRIALQVLVVAILLAIPFSCLLAQVWLRHGYPEGWTHSTAPDGDWILLAA